MTTRHSECSFVFHCAASEVLYAVSTYDREKILLYNAKVCTSTLLLPEACLTKLGRWAQALSQNNIFDSRFGCSRSNFRWTRRQTHCKTLRQRFLRPHITAAKRRSKRIASSVQHVGEAPETISPHLLGPASTRVANKASPRTMP